LICFDSKSDANNDDNDHDKVGGSKGMLHSLELRMRLLIQYHPFHFINMSDADDELPYL